MTGAIIGASASLLVAVLAFFLNRRSQRQLESYKLLLLRVNAQLRDLYGPLYAMVSVNERLWESMHGGVIPNQEGRTPLPKGSDKEKSWTLWLDLVLMPANIRMRDAIVEHVDLVIEDEMPEVMLGICTHVGSYEVYLSKVSPGGTTESGPLIRHPGAPYVYYVRNSFLQLKREQRRLLGLTAPA